jgi:ADP-dependent NAD(P)H-hydrate dehydratase / NAD(P)H-hydrate epimerase
VIPVVTPEEMGAIDRASPEPVEVLIGRAGAAVARSALGLLGGAYGRRVVVVAGPGNNGNDGREAARRLAVRGVSVLVFDATDAPDVLPPSDLVIDAAFGTGLRDPYQLSDPDGAPVLAVDIPSGVDGLTGVARGRPGRAVATVTFAALKPGLVLGAGPDHAGEVSVADIGLDVSGARIHLVEDADVVAWVPDRAPDAHKWRHAVRLVAGSVGMSGSARLAAASALAGGAGYVRLSSPGVDDPPAPVPAVVTPLAGSDWAEDVLADVDRFAALAVGPGLGTSGSAATAVRRLVESAAVPVVLDGDGITALGSAVDAGRLLGARTAPTVITPHDGEFARLTGTPPADDRVAAARDLAGAIGATVLLKGPTTVVADPDGAALLVRRGDQRLATAGTGDVLTGLVAAHLALGVPPLRAAAAAAHLHGIAATLGPDRGLDAELLASLVPSAWSALLTGHGSAST